MFRNRLAQKPGDELYANFRQAFPELGPPALASSSNVAAANPRSMSLGDVTSDTTMSTQSREFDQDHDGFRDLDQTPRGNPESWRLDPSLLDPTSYAFTSFANQPPGYSTPTPGGTNTYYHSQAGDLHTVGLGLGQVTPLSLPTSGGAQLGSAVDIRGFPEDSTHQTNPFVHFDPFQQQASFAPSQFHNQPIHNENVSHSPNASPMDSTHMDHDHQRGSSTVVSMSDQESVSYARSHSITADRYRFHVTLHAPTAMIKRADEIPVTYLNKGQAYTISIVDTTPSPSSALPITYRTFIRVSFEDEQQRQRPGACWQLWKEGRGINEAHQRGGKLQAVECVDPTFTGDSENRHPKVDLESASFDGFSVTWTPPGDSPPECSVAVRFNFLSTDFSHSKGVKGIPVRLCAKTEIVPCASAPDTMLPSTSAAELCFCKVKLFRDHGAERKLSNDVAHVKKTIEKLKQQITQAEAGMKDFGKKKQSPSTTTSTKAAPVAIAKPGKVVKHKRTWSVSTADSSGEGRSAAEDDLHQKLVTMQDMFSSTRPVSVLYLRGLDLDDPDLHPVHLSGEPLDLMKIGCATSEMWERRRGGDKMGQSTGDSSLISPASSTEARLRQPSSSHPPARTSYAADCNDLQPMIQADLQANPQHLASPPDQTVIVSKNASDGTGLLEGYIDAVGVDTSYRPPPANDIVRPVACLYILPRLSGQQSSDPCYRAVYLMQRTVQDLVRGVTAKLGINSESIGRAIYVNAQGLQIIIDDDVVHQIPEGQDMILEMGNLDMNHDTDGATVKAEWQPSPDSDNHIDRENMQRSTVYELKLIF